MERTHWQGRAGAALGLLMAGLALVGCDLNDAGGQPDAPPPEDAPPVDCSALERREGVALCDADRSTCELVYEDGQGCRAACAAAGLICLRAHENLDGVCAADYDRPALDCETGHQSDFCICGRPQSCVPLTCETAFVECGGDHDDGCGGRFACPDACPGGSACQGGRCERDVVRCTPDDCPAFPGAEGEGMYARGGRGGDVYHVTTTADSGAGSLRAGLAGEGGPRTIVFDIGGLIDLRSPLRSDRSNLTIAGQTAPGDGITIRGYQTELRGDNLVVQHVRFRAGDIRKMTRDRDGFTEDSLTVSGSDIIVDHVSASWGIDENLSAGSEITNLTVQYSIIAEGLHRTRLWHGEYLPDHGGHSMGSLFKPSRGNGEMSIHHNLYAHNNNRNPAIGTYDRDQRLDADIRNNVVYNCPMTGYTSGDSERIRVNYVGNTLVSGPDSDYTHLFRMRAENRVSVYARDNRRDLFRDGRINFDAGDFGTLDGDFDRAGGPFMMRPVTTHPAEDAFEIVLAQSGARPWSRDAVDRRIVQDVRAGTGRRIDSQDQVGGWPEVRAGSRVIDRDRDGVPDAFERRVGTDPDRPDHNGDNDGDGYTNLENYLHFASTDGP